MDKSLGVIEWISIIAGIITIVSVCLNIIQWQKAKTHQKLMLSRLQASFNVLGDIKYLTNLIFRSKNKNNLTRIESDTAQIRGICKAARQELVAYAKEHYEKILKEDRARGEEIISTESKE